MRIYEKKIHLIVFPRKLIKYATPPLPPPHPPQASSISNQANHPSRPGPGPGRWRFNRQSNRQYVITYLIKNALFVNVICSLNCLLNCLLLQFLDFLHKSQHIILFRKGGTFGKCTFRIESPVLSLLRSMKPSTTFNIRTCLSQISVFPGTMGH